MSYGYRGNGGVIGYVHSWTATKSGVWDTSVRYANQVPAPPNQPGEYQYTTVGSHTFTVPLGITSIWIGACGAISFITIQCSSSYSISDGISLLIILEKIVVSPEFIVNFLSFLVLLSIFQAFHQHQALSLQTPP